MTIWQALGDGFAQTLREAAGRGRKALLWPVALGAVSVLGAGLLVTSALLGLSAWLGPVAATGLAGLALLAAAAVARAILRYRAGRTPVPVVAPPPRDRQPEDLLPELAFGVGLALSRSLFGVAGKGGKAGSRRS